MTISKSRKRATIQWRAKTLLEVVKETGVFNLTETHRRCFPNQSELSHKGHSSRDIGTPEVLEKVMKMLRADDNAMKKLCPDDIVKSLMTDLNRIDAMIDGGDLGPEDLARFLRLKDGKLKLLGSRLGMWNADKAEDTADSDPDKLFNRFGGNN